MNDLDTNTITKGNSMYQYAQKVFAELKAKVAIKTVKGIKTDVRFRIMSIIN